MSGGCVIHKLNYDNTANMCGERQMPAVLLSRFAIAPAGLLALFALSPEER